MDAVQFIVGAVNNLHQATLNDVKSLTPAQLKWKPAPGANPVGFLFWHIARVEDNFTNNWQKKAPAWEADRWFEKMGLDVKAFGMGFQPAEVDKIAALPLPPVIDYAEKVYRSTAVYLQSLSPDRLDDVPNPERPNWTIGTMINNFVIAHGWWHLGEIRYVKGLQGMPAPR